MSASDFDSEVSRNSSSSSFNGGMKSSVLYKGSDEDFHYFYLVPKVGFSRSIKVSKEELLISDEFIFSDNEDKWLDYDTVR